MTGRTTGEEMEWEDGRSGRFLRWCLWGKTLDQGHASAWQELSFYAGRGANILPIKAGMRTDGATDLEVLDMFSTPDLVWDAAPSTRCA